ncbi:hypothetical protein [Achromobacter spanius]|uniref:Uncharacterized protein n=1 Tax=Achromobacter spanius TaxID=217203 RepID=A0A2S0I4I2_9BURK|nr:hypothetical protein [Achromobacter spanius]AVJ26942.1 hypothetical protein CLM73_07280 [Achromobacter spanius]
MSAFFFAGIPEYQLRAFRAVRSAFDNLSNVLTLAEILNTCAHCRENADENSFDVAIFTGNYARALVRTPGGYFSMAIPFQLVETGGQVSFVSDRLSEEISGRVISVFRNAINTAEVISFSHEDIILSLCENFGLEVSEALLYVDAFMELMSDDHGYLRFDDDPVNENGQIHPRYHFDFFFKNSTSIKIGAESKVDIGCFYALFDKTLPKRFMR